MLGVCYYPEHWPEENWPNDAARMADIGIRFVRIAEFAWSRLEPSRDDFRWDWLDRAIETLGAAGLKVVMSTPTATPPKWLIDARPEILPYDADGRPRRFGSRRHYCFSSPAWLEETRRICEAVADRYGENAHVAGWQLCNEYGCHDTVLSYAAHCRPAFQEWLRRRYETIETLNGEWGTVFWSKEYAAFAEIDLPNQTVTEPNPAHSLDFRRFSSDAIVAYNRLQAEIVRARSPGRFISHNFMGYFDQFDHYKVSADLDVATWDSYPLGFTDERMGLPAETRIRWARSGHPDVAAFHHDLYRGMTRGGRWWVMEQQPGPVNWAPHNPAPADGMVRLWTWEALAHGAEVVSYFRWRQAPFAQEQMHAGLNLPDGTPDVGSREAAQVGRELAETGFAPTPEAPAPVALVFDYEAAWAIGVQPQGAEFDYQHLVRAFYTALRRLGLDVDILPPHGDLSRYALVCVPTLPIVDGAAIERLHGVSGDLVIGPRSGSRTPSHRIPDDLPPGPLRDLIDIRITRVESLDPAMVEKLRWHDRDYPVSLWLEHVEGPLQPVARLFNGKGGAYRSGNVHYLSFWPDEQFLIDYFDSLLAARGRETVRLPNALRLRRGGGLTFAFNRAAAPIAAPAPDGAVFVLGNRQVAPYGLSAWRQP